MIKNMVEHAACSSCLNGEVHIATYPHTKVREFWQPTREAGDTWAKFINFDTILVQPAQVGLKIICVHLHAITLVFDVTTKKNYLF